MEEEKQEPDLLRRRGDQKKKRFFAREALWLVLIDMRWRCIHSTYYTTHEEDIFLVIVLGIY